MTPLYPHLLRRIIADGPLTVAQYMQECLLHPDHGYYSTRDPFGADGDFITAPEISQMFGELIGLALAQTWLDQGAAPDITLAEIGPGRGTLMADILRATKPVPGFHAALDLHLIEASPTLRALQKSKLSSIKTTWHDEIHTLPDQPLFLVANEFFDALPIRQFMRDKTGWRERRIGIAPDQDPPKLAFGLNDMAPQPALNHRLHDTKDGDLVEFCPAASAIMAEIDARLHTYGGCALVIDYGDWSGIGDTLQALSNHSFTDPLDHPGRDDLTAHVDFSALARGRQSATTKLTSQGDFLHRLGIAERTEALAKNLRGDALTDHIAAYHRLTDGDKMGTLFKVIGFFPENAAPPAGLTR